MKNRTIHMRSDVEIREKSLRWIENADMQNQIKVELLLNIRQLLANIWNDQA